MLITIFLEFGVIRMVSWFDWITTFVLDWPPILLNYRPSFRRRNTKIFALNLQPCWPTKVIMQLNVKIDRHNADYALPQDSIDHICSIFELSAQFKYRKYICPAVLLSVPGRKE